MNTALAKKAFEALQVLQSTPHCSYLSSTVCACSSASYLCTPPAQAEQQSTEFRIKAIGKALEYKHLEVLPFCLLTFLSPFAKQTFMEELTCGKFWTAAQCLPY